MPSLEAKPPSPLSSGSTPVVDVPRIGFLMWLMLTLFLIPPAMFVWFAQSMEDVGGVPNQTLWLILLGLPFPIMVLCLPRQYRIDGALLVIQGLLYRTRIPIAEITSVQPVNPMKVLFHPGSIVCSNPSKALMIRRRQGRTLIISPNNPGPFLALARTEP